MKIRHIDILLISLFLLASCSGGNSDSPEDPATRKGPATLSVAESYYYALPEGEAHTIEIIKSGSGDINWLASFPEEASWLRIVGADSGKNSGTLVVKIDSNSGPARPAQLQISSQVSGGESLTVEIAQSPAIWREPSYLYPEGPQGWEFVYEDYLSSNNPWNHSIVETPGSPVRFGSTAERFELRPGDCFAEDCDRTPPYERAENVQINQQQYEGEEIWYGFSFYVSGGYKDDGLAGSGCSCINFAQFHQSPNYDPAWMFSKNYGGDFLVRRLPTRSDFPYQVFKLIDKNQFAGRWHDILVQAKWTTAASGFMNIWVNDRLVMEYSGITRTVENDEIYFKHGLYRGSGPNTNVEIFMDEFHRGAIREEVDLRRKDI